MSAFLSGVSMSSECPVCGRTSAHHRTMPIDSIAHSPTEFGDVARCGTCSFSFISPRPTPAQTEAFYKLDSYYTHGRSHMATGAMQTFQSRLRQHLAWRADGGEDTALVVAKELGKRPAIVCDIGCGSGDLARQLIASSGYRVVGVERDREAVSFRGAGFEVFEGSIENLPDGLRPCSFDAVVMSHVLEHIVDPVNALEKASQLLRLGGRLFCVVPNNASLAATEAGLAWQHLDVPRHVNFFDHSSLNATAERAKLTYIRSFFNGYCRYFANSHIELEQRTYDALQRYGSGAPPPATKRNSQLRSWSLLARTAFSRPERKYDAVGVVAQRL